MTPTPNPYRGAVIAFATMHGKEQLARGPFRTILGAAVLAPAGIDTDQFGSFAGDIPRTLTPQQAARSKALLGLRAASFPVPPGRHILTSAQALSNATASASPPRRHRASPPRPVQETRRGHAYLEVQGEYSATVGSSLRMHAASRATGPRSRGWRRPWH